MRILALLCLLLLPAAAQDPALEPMPTFLGTVRGSDGKVLSLESDDGNTMQFRCTRRTEVFDGKKKIKATDLKIGEYVSVQGRLAPDQTMDAVVIRREHRPDM